MRKPLTEKELLYINPDKLYNIKPYVLNIKLWKKFSKVTKNVLKKYPPKKYAFDADIQKYLSKTSKGIYIFTVEPDFQIIPTIIHLLYVGKVEASNTFHQRFYDYVGSIGKKNNRRNIQVLTNLWPKKTWVYVYELPLTDPEIVAIEDSLIDTIVPPLNNKFKVKAAKDSRSIYN